MTPVPMPSRVRDLPADQAEHLRRIHAHTLEITRLRSVTTSMRLGTPEQHATSARLRGLERDRSLIEQRARDTGIPSTWIALAHRVGIAGQAWTGDQILPPPHTTVLRGGQRRIAVDTHMVADMAALTVVREHLHARHSIHPDNDSAEARQFRHAMTSLWLRATRTAAAIGLVPNAAARVSEAAGRDLVSKLDAYSGYSLDDIDTLWRDYTRPQLTHQLRALHNPRQTIPAVALPSPQQWLDTARTVLHNDVIGPTDAVAAALDAATTPGAQHRPTPDEAPPPEPRYAPTIDAGPGP